MSSEHRLELVARALCAYRSKATEDRFRGSEQLKLLKRAVFAFKDGRAWRDKEGLELPIEGLIKSISNTMVRDLSKDLMRNHVYIPIPTSAGHESDVDPDDPAYPCLHLARQLDVDLPFMGIVSASFTRVTPMPSSSRSGRRLTIREHVDSMTFDPPRDIEPDALIVLVDDIVTRGTQGLACLKLIRDAGIDNDVELWTIGATVAPGDDQEYYEPLVRPLVRCTATCPDGNWNVRGNAEWIAATPDVAPATDGAGDGPRRRNSTRPD